MILLHQNCDGGIMRKVAVIAGVIGLVVLTAVCYGSFRLYENHLSSTLKRTLLASMDSSASENDIRSYLRDARLQVRTQKDAVVLQELEDAVNCADKSADTAVRLKVEQNQLVGVS
jgi:hypothetical protein